MKKIILNDGRIKTFEKGNMDVMGVINVTPDSFYSKSRADSVEMAVAKADKMIAAGATFLDIGGESTRPGSDPVDQDDEMRRVCPVIREIRKRHKDVLISVDTYNAKTAENAMMHGADIINDISGLSFDSDMVKIAKAYEAPVVIMHINGKPKTMQKNPKYDNVVKEVYEFIERQIDFAMNNGISQDKFIIDMGIGFGKTVEHNLELLKNVEYFDSLELPHLLAVSRKSFIGKILEEDDPDERLAGTLAVTLYAKSKGVEIARVHDVKANVDAIKMTNAIIK